MLIILNDAGLLIAHNNGGSLLGVELVIEGNVLRGANRNFIMLLAGVVLLGIRLTWVRIGLMVGRGFTVTNGRSERTLTSSPLFTIDEVDFIQLLQQVSNCRELLMRRLDRKIRDEDCFPYDSGFRAKLRIRLTEKGIRARLTSKVTPAANSLGLASTT